MRLGEFIYAWDVLLLRRMPLWRVKRLVEPTSDGSNAPECLFRLSHHSCRDSGSIGAGHSESIGHPTSKSIEKDPLVGYWNRREDLSDSIDVQASLARTRN